MNDFTKTELGIIFTNLAVNPRTEKVLEKIAQLYEKYKEIPKYEDYEHE